MYPQRGIYGGIKSYFVKMCSLYGTFTDINKTNEKSHFTFVLLITYTKPERSKQANLWVVEQICALFGRKKILKHILHVASSF